MVQKERISRAMIKGSLPADPISDATCDRTMATLVPAPMIPMRLATSSAMLQLKGRIEKLGGSLLKQARSMNARERNKKIMNGGVLNVQLKVSMESLDV